MPVRFHYLPYAATGRFSALATDYLAAAPALKPFYRFAPDDNGMAEAIRKRADNPVDRQLLRDTLTRQYEGMDLSETTRKNIDALGQATTFSVCTAHQPNLLTGYLYFVYKILHAIRLSEQLNDRYPDLHFVPVYYMGSEDNDLDELGTFRYADRKFSWDGNGQKGAVGRMNPQTLKTLLNELFRVMGPPGEHCETLKETLLKAYTGHKTIGTATRYLVNELFGRYGLVILDPDDAAFKKQILPVMEDDLFRHSAGDIVGKQTEFLGAHYKVQAYPRQINLFYLHDNLRERIEQQGETWQVLNTDIRFSRAQLEAELREHPERFSPNVILRGIYQERILPNVAFIGGGAEVAYWLQLRSLFDHYNVFYPLLLLRQSFHWMDAATADLVRKTGLHIDELFLEENIQVQTLLARRGSTEWQTDQQEQVLESVLKELGEKAIYIDTTLQGAAEAALTRIRKEVHKLRGKMLRAEKRRHDILLDRLSRLRTRLFPNNGLQERVENFLPFYLQQGPAFFDSLKDSIRPLHPEFILAEES